MRNPETGEYSPQKSCASPASASPAPDEDGDDKAQDSKLSEEQKKIREELKVMSV